jgi:hypothetical protein
MRCGTAPLTGNRDYDPLAKQRALRRSPVTVVVVEFVLFFFDKKLSHKNFISYYLIAS